MASIGWKFYLVLICPSFVYIWIIYFLFPETKGRTLEEIGALFGDTNVANRWYGLTEEERAAAAGGFKPDNRNGFMDEEAGDKEIRVQQIE